MADFCEPHFKLSLYNNKQTNNSAKLIYYCLDILKKDQGSTTLAKRGIYSLGMIAFRMCCLNLDEQYIYTKIINQPNSFQSLAEHLDRMPAAYQPHLLTLLKKMVDYQAQDSLKSFKDLLDKAKEQFSQSI